MLGSKNTCHGHEGGGGVYGAFSNYFEQSLAAPSKTADSLVGLLGASWHLPRVRAATR